MTNLDPQITDALGEEVCRRLTRCRPFGEWEWPRCKKDLLFLALAQALREPAWVPEVEGCMSGWSDAPVEQPAEHPDWLLEMAQMRWNKSPHQNAVHEIATALMTPPPKPPVDDATLCWREYQAHLLPGLTEVYLSGEADRHLSGRAEQHEYQAITFALNWAKNREKRDD